LPAIAKTVPRGTSFADAECPEEGVQHILHARTAGDAVERRPGVPVIMLTAFGNVPSAVAAMRAAAGSRVRAPRTT